MGDFITSSGSVLLDTDPTSPATALGLRRTDVTTTPNARTLAEVTMFGAGTSNRQGVIALRTLNPGTSTGLVERMRIHTNGCVGIGTPAPTPTQALEVAGTVKATAFQGNGSALTGISDPSRVSKAGDTMTGPLSVTAAGTALSITNNAAVGGTLSVGGNVGIGTTDPAGYRLNVSAKAIKLGLEENGGGQLIIGNNPNDNRIYIEAFSSDGQGHAAELLLTGRFAAPVPQLSLVADRINLNGQVWTSGTRRFDLAEVTPVRAEDHLEQGDAVVIDREDGMRVSRSTRPYDSAVYGIVSSYQQAAMVIGGFGGPEQMVQAKDKLPIALVGRVKVKVSAENGSIRVGDLLTTSSTPGHLMRCEDPGKHAGAIAGKALEPFAGETGFITALVTLQ